MEQSTVTGIDTAKRSMELCLMTVQGKILRQRRISRGDLLQAVSLLPKNTLIGMEACGGTHYWAREIEKLGYRIRLIPPQYARPFRKRHKNDKTDAQAIAIATSRFDIPEVGIKTQEQQEIQMLHSLRERAVQDRTAAVNALHGFFLEAGIALAKSKRIAAQAAAAMETRAGAFGRLGAESVQFLLDKLKRLDGELKELTNRIERYSANHPVCQRLESIMGVGPIIATAVVAKVSKPSAYSCGRNFSASVGLTPNQFSTGGRERLGHISKRGDRYLRKLFVLASHSMLKAAELKKKTDPHSLWAVALRKRKGWKIAVVGIANKLARIIWKLLISEEEYDPRKACGSLTQPA
jgi:transposase